MNNNKICSKCGLNNQSDSNFCINCGTQLAKSDNALDSQNNIQQSVTDYDDSKGTSLGIISLVLYFIGSFFVTMISYVLPPISAIASLCPLAGIVVMITGRIKYPNNKLLKIAMWIIIVSIILCLIAFILLFIWCYITCTSITTSGCD